MPRRPLGLLITLALGLLMAPLATSQPPTGKVYRIGSLGVGASIPEVGAQFWEEMRRLGYIPGHNLFFEPSWAETPEQLPARAAELVARQVDLIMTLGTPATRAAQQATATIPIVFGMAADPVGTGLVASLARPGGNVTGLSLFTAELGSKRLELLTEAGLPLSRVAVLFNPTNPASEPQWHAMSAAGTALGIQLYPVEVRDPPELEDGFRAMTQERVTAVMVLQDPLFLRQRHQLVGLAARTRLPMISPWREVAEAGGFMSYGEDPADLIRRAAVYVDKILKGARPADLPVERPMKFKLVINLKTAEALGLTLPPTLLFQADEVLR